MKNNLKRLIRYVWILAFAWTIIFAGLLVLYIGHSRDVTRKIALREARVHFNKDQAIRLWSTSHGGVYVPVDEHTPPNPYLNNIPERDIETPSGKQLTLMNPAYMIRQLNERYRESYGVYEHITSLKPLRPENAPDEWERDALESFERGGTEVSQFTLLDGEPYLRLMQPMIAEEGCLKCHAEQGYNIGDIRGGIGVSLPLTPLLSSESQMISAGVLCFILLWTLGLIGILIGSFRLIRYEKELGQYQDHLEEQIELRTSYLETANVKLLIEITERKRAEQEIFKAKEAAEAATRTKSEFLANMSHEIRTPLNAIIGFSRIVFNREIGELNQTQSEYLCSVLKSSEHLLSLINDILDFSKIEAGKLELENIDFNLNEIVEEVINLMRLKAEEKSIRLLSHIDSDVPEYLRGDPTRLRQILLNLVNNAIKFTPKGEVRITVQNAECKIKNDNSAHCTLHFEISDTGIGIPKDRLERLFQAFSQADSSTTRRFGGTGLGLVISKALIEMMNGQIGVESEEGKGTAFRFTAEFEKGVKCDVSGVMKEDNLNTFHLTHNTSLHILLVEDNKLNQKLALYILKKQGFEADVADNGRKAIRALQTVSYDLVLMDIQMPEMDGLEAARFIRKPESEVLNPNVPIIAMTANAMKSDREACFQAGMNDYISKPIEAESLLKVIQRQLNRPSPQLLSEEGAGMRSVFDKAEFSERMGGDECFCKDMAETFLKYFPDMIENLKTALNENDAKAARLHAHSLKGSCGNMSAHRLSDLSAEMETLAQNNRLDKVRSMMGNLEAEFEKFVSVLKKEFGLY